MDSISQGKNEVIAKSGTYTLIDVWLVLGRWQEKRRVRRYLAPMKSFASCPVAGEQLCQLYSSR